MQATEDEKKATSADFYFDQKARFSTHEVLIKDNVRQHTLSKCLHINSRLLKGSTVLVVGSGIGLISFQCAQYGAEKVIGIDESAIVQQATVLAAENNLSDKVSFVMGNLCETQLPIPDHSVDLIICEWVGHLLTNDPILKQLLHARDKYLKKDSGVILPNKATLHLTACEDREFKSQSLEFWDNVYGFRMEPMKKLVYREPIVSGIPPKQIVTRPCMLHEVDIMSMTEKDLSWSKPFKLLATRSRDYIHYLVTYFVMEFASPGWSGFTISTAPGAQPTHWQQTAFSIIEDLPINTGDEVHGTMSVRMNDKGSDCLIDVNLKLDTKTHSTDYTQHFCFRSW